MIIFFPILVGLFLTDKVKLNYDNKYNFNSDSFIYFNQNEILTIPYLIGLIHPNFLQLIVTIILYMILKFLIRNLYIKFTTVIKN